MQNGSPRFVMIGAPANSSTSDPYAISRVIADHNKHAISHGDKLRDHLEAKRKEGSRVATAARVQRHNAEDYMKMVGSRLKELADSSKRFVKQLHTPGTAGDGAVMQAGSGWGGNGCDYGKLDDRRPQVVQTARCEVVNVAEWVKNSPRYSATNYASTTTTATNRRNTKLLPSLNTSSNSISLSPNGQHGRSSSGGGRNASIMPPRRGTTLSTRGGGVATSGGGGLYPPSPQITTTAATVSSSPSSPRIPNPPTSTSSTAANSPLTSQQKRQLSIAARTASLVVDPATTTPLVRVTASGSISGEGGAGSTLFEMPRLLVSSDVGGGDGGGTLDASALVSPPSPSGISAPFIVSSSSLSIKHHHQSTSAPTGQPTTTATTTAGSTIVGRRSTPSALTSHFVTSPPSAVPSPEDSFNCSAHSVPPPNYYAPPPPHASSSNPASRRHSLDGNASNTSAANIEGWGGGSSSHTPSSQQLLHHPHPPPPAAALSLPPPLSPASSTTLQTTTTAANNKPAGATPHRRAAASFALPHSSHPLGGSSSHSGGLFHTATSTTGGSSNDEATSSSSGSLHPLSRREVQQAELDFLMLSYGSTHIQLKHLKEWGPEQSCHAGKQRIKFFTLVGAAETLGVEELSFTDFLVTATGLSATQVRAAIGKYALQIGWAKDLGLIMANRVSRAYKLLTEEGAQLADFESYVKFHKSIKDDKIVSEASLFAIFTKADADNDGLLSKKEYASLFANHPASTRVLLGGL